MYAQKFGTSYSEDLHRMWNLSHNDMAVALAAKIINHPQAGYVRSNVRNLVDSSSSIKWDEDNMLLRSDVSGNSLRPIHLDIDDKFAQQANVWSEKNLNIVQSTQLTNAAGMYLKDRALSQASGENPTLGTLGTGPNSAVFCHFRWDSSV